MTRYIYLCYDGSSCVTNIPPTKQELEDVETEILKIEDGEYFHYLGSWEKIDDFGAKSDILKMA